MKIYRGGDISRPERRDQSRRYEVGTRVTVHSPCGGSATAQWKAIGPASKESNDAHRPRFPWIRVTIASGQLSQPLSKCTLQRCKLLCKARGNLSIFTERERENMDTGSRIYSAIVKSNITRNDGWRRGRYDGWNWVKRACLFTTYQHDTRHNLHRKNSQVMKKDKFLMNRIAVRLFNTPPKPLRTLLKNEGSNKFSIALKKTLKSCPS